MTSDSPHRIGQGFDVHRFASGRKLIVGGVEVDHPLGLEGHSDADVLSHAIGDALLGAAALGDLGAHFPDSDPRFKDVSSLELLGKIVEQLTAAGWRIVNVDSTIIAEAPKFAPYIGRMRENLAGALGVEAAVVSVKATTTEGLGFAGRGEGIAATAVALIGRIPG